MDELDMMSDSVKSQQVPSYFLQEASELLQQMDDELQTLGKDFCIQKVHTLMRIAHTLKGAAASVGLDTIKKTTHSLEDVFRALCAPDASLNPAVEGLIFDIYACLQLLISAQCANADIDESSVLDRMAHIVAQLQEHLGEHFGQDVHLPTSTELGFDMTQSVFEMGVTQQLVQLENALKNPDPAVLTALLQSQADIFFGLGESLNLPGFGAIAQTTLQALDHNPDKVVQIAKAAFEDYRSGQAQILQGDRSQGGGPGPKLQRLSGQTLSKKKQLPSLEPIDRSTNHQPVNKPSWFNRVWEWLVLPIPGTPRLLKAHTSPPALPALPQLPPSAESIEDALVPAVITPPISTEPISSSATEIAIATPSVPPIVIPEIQQQHSDNDKSPTLQSSATLRVSVSHLEEISYTVGELLTQQKQQALYNEQITETVKQLTARLFQQQQYLYKLQLQASQQLETAHLQSHPHIKLQGSQTQDQFDSLELDRYNDFQLFLQTSLESIIQKTEKTDAIELFLRQSNQTLDNQQRLVDNLRKTLLDVRMHPLGTVFQRFHQVLKQLSTQHSKSVTLKLFGTDILVDKVVSDRLYEPLLHLVRNAFNHGIEPIDIRQQKGKSDTGLIQLYASQTSRYLTIQVRDNGRGLNFEAICQTAIENQLITPEEANSSSFQQISNLIFEPGFSTTPEVDELSGRGIGLNIVRSQIQALEGTVSVEYQKDQGTCFTLKIPTNLTIAKLLLCQAANKQYAIITDAIRQVVVPTSEQLSISKREKLLSLQMNQKDHLIPVLSLSKLLTYHSTLSDRFWNGDYTSFKPSSEVSLNPIILIQYNHQLVGLEVDHLIGEQELVIRPLGQLMETPTYIYGCSSLPDGRLSLVLDSTALVEHSIDIFPEVLAELDIKRNDNIENSDDLELSLLAASRQKVILIIDDSITVRSTLAETLHKAGYSVVQAKEGTEAFQQLHEIQVDAILCDLEMPGMNGFDFLKERQQLPEIASIPTIMLTSRAGSKHQTLAKELGANAYLTKPYLAPQLLETLATAFEKSSHTPPSEPLENNYV